MSRGRSCTLRPQLTSSTLEYCMAIEYRIFRLILPTRSYSYPPSIPSDIAPKCHRMQIRGPANRIETQLLQIDPLDNDEREYPSLIYAPKHLGRPVMSCKVHGRCFWVLGWLELGG